MHDTHTITPTPYPELNHVLYQLLENVRSTLNDIFVGFYLQGSFAVGDFDVYSDCDFIVVMNRELSPSEVDALQIVHAQIFDLDLHWAKHLEGSYFPKDVLRNLHAAGDPLWYLDHGSRSLIHNNHCNTILVRWVIREYGISLAGSPPKALIDPIPVEMLRHQIATMMRDWGSDFLAHPEPYNNCFYQAFIVHNYSRMLHDLIRGYPGSKRAGTDWVKANLDSRWIGLIDRTWAGRTDAVIAVHTPADPDDFKMTLEFVQYMIAEAEQRGFLHRSNA